MTDTTTHCRPDFLPWEKRATCIKCAAPLADNPLVREAHKMNVVNAWAKQQLSILADMAEDRGIDWFAGEARRVADGLLLLDDCPDNRSNPRQGTAPPSRPSSPDTAPTTSSCGKADLWIAMTTSAAAGCLPRTRSRRSAGRMERAGR